MQQQDQSEEEVVPGREDDLKLSDVPEDMREAVQGLTDWGGGGSPLTGFFFFFGGGGGRPLRDYHSTWGVEGVPLFWEMPNSIITQSALTVQWSLQREIKMLCPGSLSLKRVLDKKYGSCLA